jgi:hypothetical protein
VPYNINVDTAKASVNDLIKYQEKVEEDRKVASRLVKALERIALALENAK